MSGAGRAGLALAVAAVAGLCTLAWSPEAGAHNRSVSYSSFALFGEVATVRVELSLFDHGALQAALQAGEEHTPKTGLPEHLMKAVGLRRQGVPCVGEKRSFYRLRSDRGWVRYEWQVRCPAPAGDLVVRSDLLFDVVPAHIHFTTVKYQPRDGSDRITVEQLLDENRREVAIRGPGKDRANFARTFQRYIRLGLAHILGGWDHLVFVLALVLIARRVREILVVVTGFTLGHSVTLGLAATGFATPDVPAVEALIGLSIALVAVENVWLEQGRPNLVLPAGAVLAIVTAAVVAALRGRVSPVALAGVALFAACYFELMARARRPLRLRSAVAALFGLVHGFGFAGALRPFSGDALALPLAAFNIGVELGQLALLAAAWPLFRWLCRRLGSAAVVDVGSALAMTCGVFWLITRAYL